MYLTELDLLGLVTSEHKWAKKELFLHTLNNFITHIWLSSLLSLLHLALAIITTGVSPHAGSGSSGLALLAPLLRSSPLLLSPSPSPRRCRPSPGSGSSGRSLPTLLLPAWLSSPCFTSPSPSLPRVCRPTPGSGSSGLALLSWPGTSGSPGLAWPGWYQALPQEGCNLRQVRVPRQGGRGLQGPLACPGGTRLEVTWLSYSR